MKAIKVSVRDTTGEQPAAAAEQQLAQEVQWMREVAQGDASAYRALSERYLSRVLNYATRLLADRTEAEDVAQETFLRLWKHAERWEPKAKPSTWLYRIAHNLCIDRLRARRANDEEALDRQSSGDRPSALLARKQLVDEVQAALDLLPERQRAAVVLTHFQGLSNPQAAEVLEVGVEAVESLLSRGRRSLRKHLSPLLASHEG